MRLFRSEEHARRSQSVANVLSLTQINGLARAWYGQKLAVDWRRHAPDEAERIFASLGLDREFWRLR